MKHDIYHCHQWNPELKEVAGEIISKIKIFIPGVEVLFMGAGALELPGKNDIDLDILCSQKDLDQYANKIGIALGVAPVIDSGKAFWNYEFKGYEIDALLSDPTTPDSHIPRQRKNFDTLKSNLNLQKEYARLKLDCDGLPYNEYEAKKKSFLDKLAAL